jgi:tryptophan-rich sensory protein
VDAALQTQMTIAALVCSAFALFFSLVAAFPGLKTVLAAIRDGVLWFALFLVLGGVAFVVWQQVQQQAKSATPASLAVGQASRLP